MMTEAATLPITLDSTIRLHPLSQQRENGVVIIGRGDQFLELPSEGTDFLAWLAQDLTLNQARERFEARYNPFPDEDVLEVVDAGLIALLHLDSDWTRELERFTELPKAKCIMALDGETDIFMAKKVLGNHMCLMGDVSASMLYLEEPENVHAYSTKLIRELGPEGFILQSGCDIPANAKLENVRAMVAAAMDA